MVNYFTPCGCYHTNPVTIQFGRIFIPTRYSTSLGNWCTWDGKILYSMCLILHENVNKSFAFPKRYYTSFFNYCRLYGKLFDARWLLPSSNLNHSFIYPTRYLKPFYYYCTQMITTCRISRPILVRYWKSYQTTRRREVTIVLETRNKHTWTSPPNPVPAPRRTSTSY